MTPHKLSPRPEDTTFRARCDCSFWTAVQSQLRSFKCRICGAVLRPCVPLDFETWNLVDIVVKKKVEEDQTPKVKKGKRNDPQMIESEYSTETKRMLRGEGS